MGPPFPDPARSDHRFVPIIKGKPFRRPVSLRDVAGLYYETESASPPVAVSAVREISPITYHRILGAADVAATALERVQSTEDVMPRRFSNLLLAPPKDALLEIIDIPAGAGYIPRKDAPPDIYEAAALQERARADHQSVLKHLARMIQERGGKTWYNNNIDLFGDVEGAAMLIEAKSLTNASEAVNRMRYGMGQLFDYRFRYKTEVAEAQPVLAFGNSPQRGDEWIGDVLQENGVAFISLQSQSVVPLNRLGEALPIFG